MASVKVEHINPFIRATIETFKTMLHTDVVPGKVLLVKDKHFPCDISGIIGLSGGAKGMVSLGFSRLTALKAISAFVGERVVTLDRSAADAIGELANIVAGSAKKDLSQYNINISLPSVVMGDNHELQGTKDVIQMTVPFESALGQFTLLVSFKSEE
jgi:chemotaxis protein CheX